MNEASFKNLCRRKAPEGTHWQTIETSTGRGVPDVSACYEGWSVWLEFKVDWGSGILLRPEQRVWSIKRKEAGGHVIVLSQHYKTEIVSFHSITGKKEEDGEWMMWHNKHLFKITKTPWMTANKVTLEGAMKRMFDRIERADY